MKNSAKKFFAFLVIFCAAVIAYCPVSANASTELHKDLNVSIVYNGVTKEKYGDGYDINLIVENFSNRSIEIQVEEMSINGYTVNPICSISTSPGKRAFDSIYILSEEARRVPASSIKEIEVKFRIFDWDDFSFGYESKRIRLHITNNSVPDGSQGTGGIIPSLTAKACKGFPSKIKIPVSNMQSLSLVCSDNCGAIASRIGQGYESVNGNSYAVQIYNMVFNSVGMHVITAYDGFGNAVSSVSVNVSEEHSYGAFGDRVKQPTCTEDGIITYTCSICGFKNMEQVKATGHYYNDGVITKRATCVESGTKTFTCSKCKESYTETIPSTGIHEFSEWEVEAEPTALEEGEETRECEGCGKEEYRTVEKLESEVGLSKKKANLKVGKKLTLKIKDKTYGDYVKSWKVSNKKVASIKSNGNKCVVKALKPGKATITLIMESGCKSTCVVEVKTFSKIKNIRPADGELVTILMQKSNEYYETFLKIGSPMTHKVNISANSIVVYGNLEDDSGYQTGYAKHKFKISKNVRYLSTGGNTKGQEMTKGEFQKSLKEANDSQLAFILEFKNGKVVRAIMAS